MRTNSRTEDDEVLYRVTECINVLKSSHTSCDQKNRAAETLTSLVHFQNPLFKQHQQALFEINGIDVLISVACEIPQIRRMVFAAVGGSCFFHENISKAVASSKRLLSLIYQLITSESEPEVVQSGGLYVIQNSAANSWDVHPHLFHLIRPILEFYGKSSSPESRDRCMGVFLVLSYNPVSRPHLVEAGVINFFQHLISSEDYPNKVAPAIGIACLVGNDSGENVVDKSTNEVKSDDPNHPLLILKQGFTSYHLIKDIADALYQTLNGRAYRGSFFTPWKIMLGIMNLCDNTVLREYLISEGLFDLLKQALTAKEDPKLVQMSLRTLWKICAIPKK